MECFGSPSDVPSLNEALTYYQVDENGVETLIGTFYAIPSVPSNGMYSFTAYDIVSKLDADFSARLWALQTSFPMSAYDLVSAACSVAGVTLADSSWPTSTMQVNAFYADGLTCRNILQYAAELACRFVRCNVRGEIVFDWYKTNVEYSIAPGGNQNASKVAYRLGGLTYSTDVVKRVDSVVIKSVGELGARFIYPEYNWAITATDPDDDGNITMMNVTVTDSGDGHLTIIARAEDTDLDGNVVIEDKGVTEHSITIASNLFLTDASEETYLLVAENVLRNMIVLPVYRYSDIQLFPNENPFRAGQFVSVEDVNGVSFMTPIFTMSVAPNGVTIHSSGSDDYDAIEASTVAKTLARQDSDIVRINRLKVGWAEIDTAVINALIANGIDAEWINTGYLDADRIDAHSIAVGKLTGSISNNGWVLNLTDGTLTIGNISAANINAGTLSADRLAANSIAVGKLTGSISNNGWVLDLDNGTLTLGNISADNINAGTLNAARIGANSIAVSKLTGSIASNGWTIDLTNGTLTIGNISANNINAGTLNVDRIAANSLDVAKLTGAITTSDGWEVDLLHETFTVGELSADKITSGALTVKDANDFVLFNADVSTGAVKIGGWKVDSDGYLVPDGFIFDANILAGCVTSSEQVLFNGVGSDAVVQGVDGIKFINGLTDRFYPSWTSTYGVINGLSVPRVIWENSNTSTGMAAQTLTLKTPATADDPVTDMSLFNYFFVEILWHTGVTKRRAGTWVYVPDGETVVAVPSISCVSGSAMAHMFRYVTINRANNTISIANGNLATPSGVTANTTYALPTRILAMKV